MDIWIDPQIPKQDSFQILMVEIWNIHKFAARIAVDIKIIKKERMDVGVFV